MSDDKKKEKKIINLQRDRSPGGNDGLGEDEGEFVRTFEIDIVTNGGYALRIVYNTGDSDLLFFPKKEGILDLLTKSLI